MKSLLVISALSACCVNAVHAQQPEIRPRLMALEHTNAKVFALKPSISPATRRHLEKIVIFSAIVYASDEFAPGAIDTKYGLSIQDKWIINRTAAKQLMLAKVASLDREVKQRCAEHLRKHPYWSTTYHAYVLESFDDAPDFKFNGYFYTYTEKRFRQASEALSRLMRSVYEEGGGKAGWQPLFDIMEKYQIKPDRLSDIERRLYEYVRMRKPRRSSFSVLYNPLMKAEIGTNAFPDPKNTDAVVFISGPWPTTEGLSTNISHEMMHPIMNRLRRYSRPFQEALLRTEAVDKRIVGERWGYNGWFSYFAEETIRCVSSRIEKSPQHKFQHSDFIAEQLPSYESSKVSFEQFLIRVLDRLHLRTEQQGGTR